MTADTNPTAQELLREETRDYSPEIAEALDAGDVKGAARVWLELHGEAQG